MSDAPSSYGSLPTTALEFGTGLRALRGVSLRDLAARQPPGRGALVLSKSQLQRYETGQLLPPLRYAGYLDALYDANGWVKLSLAALYAASWDPWVGDQTPATTAHVHEWPASYRCPVWLLLKPHAENTGRTHTLTLDWGAWSAALTLEVGAKGLVLTTGKSVDRSGVAVTFHLESDAPVFTLFGAGGPPSGYPVTSIHRKWRYGDVRLPLWQRFRQP